MVFGSSTKAEDIEADDVADETITIEAPSSEYASTDETAAGLVYARPVNQHLAEAVTRTEPEHETVEPVIQLQPDEDDVREVITVWRVAGETFLLDVEQDDGSYYFQLSAADVQKELSTMLTTDWLVSVLNTKVAEQVVDAL